MKKKIIVIGIIVLIALGLGFYLYSKDNIRFKISYEILNDVELSNGKKIKVNISLDNRVKYLNNKELDSFLKSGTGILYLGYNSCPWCRNIVPILIDVVKDNDIDTINYVDIHKNDISNIDGYKELEDYFKSDDDGNKVLAVPDVYVIKNGKILSHHLGTVSSYKNPYIGMNEEQIEELKSIYNEMIKEMK